MKLALAANPRSGSGDGDGVADVLRRSGALVDEIPLDRLGERRLEGCRRLVVAGGDGSLGVAAATARAAGIPLAVVPTGTANDFARAMRLPFDLDEACALAVNPDAGTRRIDIATINGHPYLNTAAAGLTVHASREANPLKPRLGALAYQVGAVRAALSARPLRCSVRRDGTEYYSGAVWQVAVASTGAFGGGSQLGGTRAGDGNLDIAVVPSGSRLSLARRAWGMRRGRLTEQADVAHDRGRTIEIDTPEGTNFNVDGELRSTRGTTRFGLLTGGVEVVVP
ncbi:diacylglycerol/lipid kinase family protein [Saccharomonospora piscinae]|uniref:DAGKc domain-containing protein n=1 Tax=Saccharomonospora piscinae TaxID=687388 RepID=A0A1V9A0P5_SACPI|nr:diacylglycerol kinase family protein [Saccharomonospora piscinae]OQO90722.1 hypothetical protein B1813_14345 [Saccharomonospora piscinae]